MDLRARLSQLARLPEAATPVVSVYLDTRWADEHQRERVRVFLKREIRRTREAGRASGEDLDWIAEQGARLVGQTLHDDAEGVVLFACGSQGLREVIPVRASLDDAFVVDQRPYLLPLAALSEDTPQALVVFVDGVGARLIALAASGDGEDVVLEHDVPGRHVQGGWAQLAQSRYQRHVEAKRGQHFEAVAEAIAQLDATRRPERIVLAGEARAVGQLRRHLPAPLAARVVGRITGARHESSAALAERATRLIAGIGADQGIRSVDAVLTEAAKGGAAVAGLEATLNAVGRGAVHRLYLLEHVRPAGSACAVCGALQPGDSRRCRVCGGLATAVDLASAATDRVIAAGGSVEVIAADENLVRAGGMAARLRYSL